MDKGTKMEYEVVAEGTRVEYQVVVEGTALRHKRSYSHPFTRNSTVGLKVARFDSVEEALEALVRYVTTHGWNDGPLGEPRFRVRRITTEYVENETSEYVS